MNYNSHFLYSEYFNNIMSVSQKLCHRISQNVHKKNVSLTTSLLLLLLRDMHIAIGKLNSQYDYPKFECHQSLNPETLYMEH